LSCFGQEILSRKDNWQNFSIFPPLHTLKTYPARNKKPSMHGGLDFFVGYHYAGTTNI